MKNIIYIIVLFFLSLPFYAFQNITYNLKVDGNCEMCKERIEKTAIKSGAKNVEWNINSKVLSFKHISSESNLQKIINAILEIGHSVNNIKPNLLAYSQLPDCCLYKILTNDSTSNLNEKYIFNLRGIVINENDKGDLLPQHAVAISTNLNPTQYLSDSFGVFIIPYDTFPTFLLIHNKYVIDTFYIKNHHQFVIINLKDNHLLNEIVITKEKSSTSISSIDAAFITFISQKELFKAACCNLSESFETNSSIDVSLSDAISGRKQIQTLGLSGIYNLITLDNLPLLRGLSNYQNLNYISGTFIRSIQLTKGIGSVINGFESITGQINVEMFNPQNSPVFSTNLYINNFGKIDFNFNKVFSLGKKWKTMIMFHNANLSDKNLLNANIDIDNNSFRDLPSGNLLTVQNTWQYVYPSNWTAIINTSFLIDNQTGGQTFFDIKKDKFTTNAYGLGWQTFKTDINSKIGYVFPLKKYKSFGIQTAYTDFNNDAFFGLTSYKSFQQSFFSTFIYQSIIKNTWHKFKTGLNFNFDNYLEKINLFDFKRQEYLMGSFFEYNFNNLRQWNILFALRADYNNLFGWTMNPRLNVKYTIRQNSSVRFSFGRGQRTANIFADNFSVFMSNRTINFSKYQSSAYGFEPEVAYNLGFVFEQKINIFSLPFTFFIDFFRTYFQNQIILNIEKPQLASFSNLDGIAYANSVQIELQTKPFKHLELKSAYRFYDVVSTIDNKILQKPFVSRQRFFIDIDFQIKKIRINSTLNWYGTKRIPSMDATQISTQSPSYFILNAQITKKFGFKEKVFVYIGAENLTNFYQDNSIYSPLKPFSNHFDASMIWGPTFGSLFYIGCRYAL